MNNTEERPEVSTEEDVCGGCGLPIFRRLIARTEAGRRWMHDPAFFEDFDEDDPHWTCRARPRG